MTTEAQLESFDLTDTASIEAKALAAMRTFGITGATADEAYARAYPMRGPRHSTVDSFRVSLRHLREDGLIRDSGLKRSNQEGSRRQTVWVLGDDRDRVEADRRRKLSKVPTDWLIDELRRRNAMPPGLTFSVGATMEPDDIATIAEYSGVDRAKVAGIVRLAEQHAKERGQG